MQVPGESDFLQLFFARETEASFDSLHSSKQGSVSMLLVLVVADSGMDFVVEHPIVCLQVILKPYLRQNMHRYHPQFRKNTAQNAERF